jgi:hypothetical protein
VRGARGPFGGRCIYSTVPPLDGCFCRRKLDPLKMHLDQSVLVHVAGNGSSATAAATVTPAADRDGSVV